jgi:phenylpyruvate tautomerase PptA (4-oxalocrotonate tautomerase family)
MVTSSTAEQGPSRMTTCLVGRLPKAARQRVVHRSDTVRREFCRSWECGMPLIRVEILEGWSPAEKARLLDAIHAAAVEALTIPDEDRTQIVTEHPAEALEIHPARATGSPGRDHDVRWAVT